MTNKRMHKLERKVRVNFQGFNRIICPKDVEIKCLDQITKLFLIGYGIYIIEVIWLLVKHILCYCVLEDIMSITKNW